MKSFTTILRENAQNLDMYSDITGPKAERVQELQKQILNIADELDTLLISESEYDLNMSINLETEEHSG